MFLAGDELAVDGLLLGGTTVTVDDFTDGEYLDHRLESATVGGPFAVEYASEQGLRQLARRAEDVVADAESAPVETVLDRFETGLHEDSEDVVYGEESVREALEYGAVATLLVSGDRGVEQIREFEEMTAAEGGDGVVVPPDTDHGARFAEAFGVAALLRFPVD
jgi:peptide chain release factor subunit 1